MKQPNNNIPQNPNNINISTCILPGYGNPQPNNNIIDPQTGFNNNNNNNNLQGQWDPKNIIPSQGSFLNQQNQNQGQGYGGQGNF